MAIDRIWRSIPGFEGYYEVSNLGEVRGVRRIDCAGRTRPGKIKAPQTNSRGYRSAGLYRDKRLKGFRIARLVLLAFIGPCPEGMEAAHNNGDPSDDRLQNLRWDTHTGNCADKVAHGTAKFYGRKKFSDNAISEIFAMRSAGIPQKDISSRIGMSRGHVSMVLSGKTRATA